MAKIGLCIELDVMRHAIIERIPEITSSSRFCTWHSEMIDIAGEVALTLGGVNIGSETYLKYQEFAFHNISTIALCYELDSSLVTRCVRIS